MEGTSQTPILVVTGVDPRGPRNGLAIRVGQAVQALSQLAPVDVAVIRPDVPVGSGSHIPVTSAAARVRLFSYVRNLRLIHRLLWLARPTLPLSMVGCDYSDLRQDLMAWLAPRYSLVWVVGTPLYEVVSPVLPAAAPVVVDVNDVESEKLSAQMDVRQRADSPRRPVARFRESVAVVQGRRNVGAWVRYDHRVVARVARAVVCSETDKVLLGVGNVEVVPNTYDAPDTPLGRRTVGQPPTLLLPGQMTYPPNVDAAEYFVGQVLPTLRRKVPGVVVRIVGGAGDRVRALADGDSVIVTGYVPHMEAELRRADVVVVPIRYGGGTRIKILEALANGIPVVSTRVGAHGLDVSDGEQILLADDPMRFADACARVLTDQDLRDIMIRRGREHFQRYFEQADATTRIHAVASAIRSSSTP